MTEREPDGAVQRIADTARLEVIARLRDALAEQAAARGLALGPEELDRLADESVAHADGALWRRALAGAASQELGLGLGEAIDHPTVLAAHRLVGAPSLPAEEGARPAAEAEPQPMAEAGAAPAAEADAVRVPAVHLGGIEALRAGERDLELRISSAGLDVLKRSSGAPIGRLEWREIERIDLPRGRRGLRPGRRAYELHVATGHGRASFELPGVTEEQLKDHLEPMLARARAGHDRSA